MWNHIRAAIAPIKMFGESDPRAILIASLISSCGTGAFSATYVAYAINSGIKPEIVASAISLGAVVGIVATPFGPAVMRRFGAKRVSVLLSVVRGVLSLGLAFTGEWGFLGVLMAFIAVERVAFPANQMVMSYVAAETDSARLIGLRIQTQTAGVALGGLGAATVHAVWPVSVGPVVFGANAASFLIAAGLYWSISMTSDDMVEQRSDGVRRTKKSAGFLIFLASVTAVDSQLLFVGVALPVFATSVSPSLVQHIGVALAVQGIVGFAVNGVLPHVVRTVKHAAIALAVAPGATVAGGVALLALNDRGVPIVQVTVFGVLIGLAGTVASYSSYLVLMLDKTDQASRMAWYGSTGSFRRIIAPPALMLAASSAAGVLVFSAAMAISGIVAGISCRRTFQLPTAAGAEGQASPLGREGQSPDPERSRD